VALTSIGGALNRTRSTRVYRDKTAVVPPHLLKSYRIPCPHVLSTTYHQQTRNRGITTCADLPRLPIRLPCRLTSPPPRNTSLPLGDHFAKSSIGFQDGHRSAGRPDPQYAFAQIGFACPLGNLLARGLPTVPAAEGSTAMQLHQETEREGSQPPRDGRAGCHVERHRLGRSCFSACNPTA
jgi:hypothetical protein